MGDEKKQRGMLESDSSSEESDSCATVEPTKKGTGRPGRRKGDSPTPYTYEEKRIVLECLLEFTPSKPCGQQFLNIVAKRLNRPASGIQTFISHRLRRELPRLLEDMYDGKYSRIGRVERSFILDFMKDSQDFKLPRKDSISPRYPRLGFTPCVTSTPSGRRRDEIPETPPKRNAWPESGGDPSAAMKTVVEEVMRKLMSGVQSKGPGTSRPLFSLGFHPSVDDWSGVAIPNAKFVTLASKRPIEDTVHEVSFKTEDPNSEENNPPEQAMAESMPPPDLGYKSGSSVTTQHSSDFSRLLQEASGFSEETLGRIVQSQNEEGDSDVAEAIRNSKLRARLVTTTAVELLEVGSEDEDEAYDYIVVQDGDKFILRHRSTLPEQWSLQPHLGDTSNDIDEGSRISKRDIVSVCGQNAVLSPMIIKCKKKDNVFAVQKMQTADGQSLAVLVREKFTRDAN